jgi:diguanylate cyclase (GGDEF)-like protein
MFDADDLLKNDPRRRFEQILLARCRAGKPFAVMLVDLEGFADVTARFGTDIASLLLYEIASRLREKLNENDLVTRRRPNEFAVFVHGIDNMESANRLAEELIDRLESPVTVSGARFRLNANIGITLSPKQSGEWRLLLQDAEEAVHDAKTQGRGRISVTFAAPRKEDE